MRSFDVIVIGGGHAGCEAATAAARRGARVALVTSKSKVIGAMSCNPAIGGIGKGHLVRELDVFDGLMARAADHAGIHYRMLNRSKGSAVRGPRVQADRARYKRWIQSAVSHQANLSVVQGDARRLVLNGGTISGLVLGDGSKLHASSIILATGTFLGGRLHRGLEQQMDGGRWGETTPSKIGRQLRELTLPIGRLKTGTPPRLDGRTIDWARLDRQPSDTDPWAMSPMGAGRVAPQITCGIARTNGETHDLIRAALDRSPLHTGAIQGSGPRYCPSIEDKVLRFGDRDGHQVFLEPEGLDTSLVYPNGISTSLPVDAQQAFVRSMSGLERAEIVQPGYAVEYDFLDPRSLDGRLALSAVPGLFCAGQINGTTGYEEAAVQGLVAGLNAAAMARSLEPIKFDRASSYIGVMIDDLTLQGVTEPYRMLTSRAEFRLHLRADNGASRLSSAARQSGAISPERRAWLDKHEEDMVAAESILADKPLRGVVSGQEQFDPSGASSERTDQDAVPATLRYVWGEAVEDARYAPYVERQRREAARVAREDRLRLDPIRSFATIAGLSTEMVERLEAAKPETLGAAARIRGITPAALSAIMLAASIKRPVAA